MINECYDIHIYCDYGPHGYGEGTGEYSDLRRAGAYRQARQDGWLINKVDGIETAKCRKCRKEKRTDLIRAWG